MKGLKDGSVINAFSWSISSEIQSFYGEHISMFYTSTAPDYSSLVLSISSVSEIGLSLIFFFWFSMSKSIKVWILLVNCEIDSSVTP